MVKIALSLVRRRSVEQARIEAEGHVGGDYYTRHIRGRGLSSQLASCCTTALPACRIVAHGLHRSVRYIVGYRDRQQNHVVGGSSAGSSR